MYIVKISELVNILVSSLTVCAMLLPICIIRRFKDPHIQASRLKSWMFCYTGHLDLRLLFNFLPYFHDNIRFLVLKASADTFHTHT